MRFSVLSAVALDLIVGDPRGLPHPVNAIGAAARAGERILRKSIDDEFIGGAVLTLMIGAGAAFAGLLCAKREPLRTVAGASTLAFRSLLDHVEPIAVALEAGDLPEARALLARCVGRDTEGLDECDVARAAIETTAESFCDGIVAPLLYLRAFGTAGALFYKAVNTLDSLIGHIEKPYTYFGRFAARLDDTLNWIPSRVAALAICVSAPAARGFPREALAVWRRDGDEHRSPNAGQTEAAMAGALGVRLGGRSSYDGVSYEGAIFGAALRNPKARDVRRALRIVACAYGVVALCAAW